MGDELSRIKTHTTIVRQEQSIASIRPPRLFPQSSCKLGDPLFQPISLTLSSLLLAIEHCSILITTKTKKKSNRNNNSNNNMVKKKSGMARRRKKSNTTTNEAAKRSKTEDEKKNPAEYRDGILQGIRAVLGKMDEKDLLAVMVYVGSMEAGAAVEKQKTTTSAKASTVGSVTATAREEAIAITNITFNPSDSPTTTTDAPANPTTTEAANPTTTQANHPPTSATTTTTVPPSPQDSAPVIQFNRKTRPSRHNIVTIDPRCFHSDGRTELEATKFKNKSINTIVHSIVKNDLTPQQRAFALKQAMIHPDVRALAKSAGLIDNQDFIKKSYILNNMKKVVQLAQETSKRNARPNNDRRSLVQSIVISSIPSTQERLNAKERQVSIPFSTEIAKLLGLNPRTFQRIQKKAQHKRDLLENVTDGML